MSKKLSEIRVEIDSIDNQVHDLLMQRASLVSSVAAAKKKEGLQIVQPAREARMMRRLLSRHEGPLPRSTIIRIWRELVGSVALLQSGFSVIVSEHSGQCMYWDIAKEYFGGTVPMRKETSHQVIFSDVLSDKKESFGVLPWPEAESVSPWWESLFHQDEHGETLSIICALPYGQSQENSQARALVVSKVSFISSDLDMSFVALEVDTTVSRSRIGDVMQEVGLDVHNLYSGTSPNNTSHNLYLIEVDGFMDAHHENLKTIKNILGDKCLYCNAVGGYPVIPDINDTEKEPVEQV
ncbi:MAG: chorismate mutase [Alphaproteobacteria bacterium]